MGNLGIFRDFWMNFRDFFGILEFSRILEPLFRDFLGTYEEFRDCLGISEEFRDFAKGYCPVPSI